MGGASWGKVGAGDLCPTRLGGPHRQGPSQGFGVQGALLPVTQRPSGVSSSLEAAWVIPVLGDPGVESWPRAVRPCHGGPGKIGVPSQHPEDSKNLPYTQCYHTRSPNKQRWQDRCTPRQGRELGAAGTWPSHRPALPPACPPPPTSQGTQAHSARHPRLPATAPGSVADGGWALPLCWRLLHPEMHGPASGAPWYLPALAT